MLSVIQFRTPITVSSELIALGAVPGGQDSRGVKLDIDRGVLIAGKPGSGKTLNLQSISESASRAGYTVIRLIAREMSPAGFKHMAEAARLDTGTPILLVIDEMDRIPRGMKAEAVAQVLRDMAMYEGVALLIAAARPEDIPVRLRPVIRTWIDMDEGASDGMPHIRTTSRHTVCNPATGEWEDNPENHWDQENFGPDSLRKVASGSAYNPVAREWVSRTEDDDSQPREVPTIIGVKSDGISAIGSRTWVSQMLNTPRASGDRIGDATELQGLFSDEPAHRASSTGKDLS